MRFPRKTKIIRGQLDTAAMMSLLFLTLLFLVLQSALVFTPGIRVLLLEEKNPQRASLKLTGKALISFNDAEWTLKKWEEHLRQLAQNKTAPNTIAYDLPPEATNELAAVRALAAELSIKLIPARERVLAPLGDAPSGAPAGGLVLMVNASGQAFLEGQWVSDAALAKRLTQLVSKSRLPLTMVLQADRAVEYDRVVQLGGIARESGVAGLVLATRPSLKP